MACFNSEAFDGPRGVYVPHVYSDMMGVMDNRRTPSDGRVAITTRHTRIEEVRRAQNGKYQDTNMIGHS